MKWSEYSNRIVWFSSKQLLLCSQGKEPSDQHIRQVCMRVMQGESGSRRFYHSKYLYLFPFMHAEPHFCRQSFWTLQAGEQNHWPLKERVRWKERKFCIVFQRFFLILLWWAESYPSVLALSKSSWAHANHSLMTFSFTFHWKIHFRFSWSALLPHSDELPPSAWFPPWKSSVKHRAAFIFRTFSDWKLKFTVP